MLVMRLPHHVTSRGVALSTIPAACSMTPKLKAMLDGFENAGNKIASSYHHYPVLRCQQ
jgi:hypothetical protein